MIGDHIILLPNKAMPGGLTKHQILNCSVRDIFCYSFDHIHVFKKDIKALYLMK